MKPEKTQKNVWNMKKVQQNRSERELKVSEMITQSDPSDPLYSAMD